MARLKYKLIGAIETKDSGSGAVRIKGFANKFIVDSVGERLLPEGCDFSRFEKNPIMLFNHDKDYVIGSWDTFESRKNEGTYVEGNVSKSETEKISYVRDLVAEGILKTLSVGYIENKAKEMPDGSRDVTDWTLHEISVVSIPCNQESVFSASLGKRLNRELFSKSLDEARTMLKEINKADCENPADEDKKPTKEKEAGTLQSIVFKKPAFDKEKVIEWLKAHEYGSDGITEDDDTVTYTVLPVEQFDPESFQKNAMGANIILIFGVEKQSEEPAEEPETLSTENEEMTEEQKAAFQDCVNEKIPKLIDEGKSREQAVAIAMEMCKNEGKCSLPAETKEITTAIPAGQPDPMGDGNPIYHAMQQTNALLGAVLVELKGMNEKLSKLALLETQEETEVEPTEEITNQTPATAPETMTESADKKLIADIKLWQNEIDAKLKQFNI